MTGQLQAAVQSRGARLNPRRRVVSAGGGAGQDLVHLGAGQSVALHDLLDVLLLFPLQNAEEVLQLWHGESVPLDQEMKCCISTFGL